MQLLLILAKLLVAKFVFKQVTYDCIATQRLVSVLRQLDN